MSDVATELDRQRPRIARAWDLAVDVHDGQLDALGEPVLGHLQRVTAAVAPVARLVAVVHDVVERSSLSVEQVAERVGLDRDERAALDVLTKVPGESVVAHTDRVLAVEGRAGVIGVEVKRADLADHVRRAPERPGYAEALARIVAATR